MKRKQILLTEKKQDDEFFSVKKRKKITLLKKNKEKKLKKDFERYENTIRFYLERNDIESVISYLFAIEETRERFLKDTKYFVFDWAIEHENLILLDWLFNNVRKEHHLLMVSHDEYSSIKNFIHNTLQMSIVAYKAVRASKQAILWLLINVGSELIDHIQNALDIQATEEIQKTLAVFKKDNYILQQVLKNQLSPKCTSTLFSPPKKEVLNQMNRVISNVPKPSVTSKIKECG